MVNFIDRISRAVGMDPVLLAKIAKTLAVLFFVFLSRAFVVRFLNRKSENVRLRFLARNAANYGSTFIIALFLIDIWWTGAGGLQTYLGLLSAGVAIALRDPLTNMAAWLFILTRKPFSVGDRIEIGGIRGDVIDIRVFQFLLLEIGNRIQAEQSTGRIVYIPNGRVFSSPTANYTVGFPFIWNEIAVLVTFESDRKRAKTILQTIVDEFSAPIRERAEKSMKQASRTFLLTFNELGPTVYTSVQESGVLLTARFLCEARRERQSEHLIWERLLDAFDEEPGIDFAYPTRRLYTAGEGRDAPRP